MKSVFVLLLVTLITANPKIRGYHAILLNEALTATMTSSYDYDVMDNPIPISVSFSNDVESFSESDCVLVNAKVKSIVKESSSTYSLSLIPDQPGFLSISLSRSIQSVNHKSLMSPPTLEFNYIGVQVISTRVTVTTQSSISISVVTSKPTKLYSLIVQSNIKTVPSETTIISDAQFISSEFSSNHLLFHTNLQENTEYVVYFTGKEEQGTSLGTDVGSTKMTVKTRSSTEEEDISSKSDGTICESGWAVSPTTNKLDLLPCSNHGYCQQSRCICVGYYRGSNCNQMEEDPLDHTNKTHQLIHAQLQLWGTFKERSKLEDYWKISLREIMSERLSLSPELIQIRHWVYLETTLAALSGENRHLVGRHHRVLTEAEDEIVLSVYTTIVTDHDMLLLVTKRLNEMVAENDLKEGMKGKMVTIQRAAIVNTFEQGNDDIWSCYDGIKNGDETDLDCGGSCVNGCMLQKQCRVGADCVDGLFCTKGKCIDRNWKQVLITSIVIIGIIVVMVVTIIVGGVVYQKVKGHSKWIVCFA